MVKSKLFMHTAKNLRDKFSNFEIGINDMDGLEIELKSKPRQ